MAWLDTAGAAVLAAAFTQGANILTTRMTQRTAQQKDFVTAQTTLETKKTPDATVHDTELAKQQKEYNDNLRADNERLYERLLSFQGQIDQLRADLVTANDRISENTKTCKIQEAQLQNMREREAMTLQDHQDQVTMLHDKYVDTQRKLTDSQAREQTLNLRLKNCKCMPGRIDINSETIHLSVEGPSDIIGGTQL